MRKMGGLRTRIPVTYVLMLIGTLALTGVGIPGTPIGFAGFFSKDSIVETAYAAGGPFGGFAFWSLVIAALFTSFYSWRLIFLTFHGTPRWEHHEAVPAGAQEAHGGHTHHEPIPDANVSADAHAADETHGHGHIEPHESPPVMIWPLYVLGAGAVLAGAVFYGIFFADPVAVENFFKGALVVDEAGLEAAHAIPLWAKWSATIAMLIGLALAWQMYMRDRSLPVRLARANPGLYQFLLNKWYFDELYDRVIIRPAKWIGTAFWRGFDDWLIDRTIVEGLGNRVVDVTRQVVRLQSGYLYHYAFAMLIGIAALLTWAIASGGLLG
jgi:NADH-quinone oxidoreductase subunit L